ncbi:MAG: SHOCT domain-containing protein [Burkholderiales bacterium]|nr:SHOCT domain-containing protein [Burkholderiales bacterium]
MKKLDLPTLLLLLALLAAPAVQAQVVGTPPLLDITDPEGDDHGAGNLVYPRDGAFARGDLDLRRLRVFAEPGGLRFEATFANPVRLPSSVRGTGLGAEDLSLFARRGFYAFNLDLYLDTDGVPGSGVLATLPGRGARLHAAHAWDKAIVLTPRPELMRRQLTEALADASADAAGRSAAAAEVGKAVYFATDVRVRANTVTFTVPRSFIEPSAFAGASVTALVTAAKLAIEAPFGTLTLGAQAPAAGRPEATMGYGGDKAPATAVVDLLASDPARQATQLASGSALMGTGGAAEAGSRAAPAGAAGAADPDGGASRSSWLAQALDILTGFVPRPQPAAVQAGANATATAPAVAAPAATRASEPPPRRPRDAAFYEQQELRLRALQRLREQGLITEEEYQRKRREILDAL